MFDFIRRHSGGIEAADNSTHRSAGDDVNFDAGFFQRAQDADMGKSACAAAGQGDADAESTDVAAEIFVQIAGRQIGERKREFAAGLCRGTSAQEPGKYDCLEEEPEQSRFHVGK